MTDGLSGGELSEIPLELIDDFPDHPFRVRMDGEMRELAESVRQRGLISPVILRKKGGGRYEIVSGHRRKKACEIAGLRTVTAQVQDMTREEAVILMVDSNLHRSVILPSEKAFSYRMRLEAMRRQQGVRTDLTSVPMGQKLTTREIVAEESPDSNTQIQRYIRLTELIPPVLEMVDEGRIGLRCAVELSYLPKREQELLLDAMEYAQCTPSHAQAIRLRELSGQGMLSAYRIGSILREEKANQKERIILRAEEAGKYLPADLPAKRAGEYILRALAFYQKYREHQREREDR